MKQPDLKIKQLFCAKNILIIAVANIIFVFSILSSNYRRGFYALADMMNYSLVNLLLFIPVCLFLICNLFNDISSYKIRFSSKKQWIKHESKYINRVLFFYTLWYVGVASLSTIIYNLIIYGNIDITLNILYGIIFYILSQYIFLIIIYLIMLCINTFFKLQISICSYIALVIIAFIYVIEIITSLNGLITPTFFIDLSLLGNIIMFIPNLLTLVFIIALFKKLEKLYV